MRIYLIAMTLLSLAACDPAATEQVYEVFDRCRESSMVESAERVPVITAGASAAQRTIHYEDMLVKRCIVERVTRCNARYKGAFKCQQNELVQEIGLSDFGNIYSTDMSRK